MRILAVGDEYMPSTWFRGAFAGLERDHDIEYLQVATDRAFVPTSASERRLSEFIGTPEQVIARMGSVDVLAVQGAPVTDAVLDASDALSLVGCARGGPTNVDVDAVTARGLPLVNTPGKNAHAVADQTIAFLVMLARGFPAAQRFVADGGRLRDNWEGSRFMGLDLRRHTLGLVGYGRVGQLVAHRARAFGMEIVVHDPALAVDPEPDVRALPALGDLLAVADFVSLHARASADNVNLFDARAFTAMRGGAFFVNTARETLVDEHALDDALSSGRLGGAALDVVREQTAPGPHPLLRHGNVVITPHIGGATRETLIQGAEMLAEEIARFAAGEPLRWAVNGDEVRT